MAALPAGKVDTFLAGPDYSYAVFLIYGPDDGLVSERADMLAKGFGVDLGDPFSLLRINADDLASDPGRLYDEVNTIGMFGGKRLIRVSGTTQRDLMKAIKPVLDNPCPDALVIVEGGDIKKSAALRRNLEKHGKSMCIPCYQDNDAALDRLIDQEIIEKNFSIDSETRSELKGLLGDNRRLSRNELIKLAIYCDSKDVVTRDDVRAIVGDASGLILNELVDAVTTGDAATAQTLFPKALHAGNNPDILLLAILRHLQMLHDVKTDITRSGQPASVAVAALRPPVHFTRKPAITRSLELWSTERLMKLMQRTNPAMLQCRQQPDAAAPIASMTLLAISLEAKRAISR